MFGMNTSNCNCTPKGAYNVQVLLPYISSLAKGFLSAPLLNNDPTRANQKPLSSEDCTGTSSY